MRIDNNQLITGNSRAEAGDMMSRLEPGDVINAKVLEISPKEAVLRLSDGTVIKAATKEPLDVKPGQSISLFVTSRDENSFVLETVKDTSQTIAADMGKLQKMLEAAGVRADDLNLKLAAEFLKFGTAPTAENISEALESMKGPEGLDIEKAVYLAVKDISTSQTDKGIMSNLLNGNLKLGQLLESLYEALNSEGNGDKAVDADTNAGQTAADTLSDTIISTVHKTEQSASEAAANTVAAESNIPLASEAVNTLDKSSSMPLETQADSATDPNITDTIDRSGISDVHQSDQASPSDTEVKSSALPKESMKAETHIKPDTARVLGRAVIEASKQSESSAKSDSATANDTITPAANDTISSVAAKNSGTRATGIKQSIENFTGDPLERINASIERIYVDINKQLSGEELDFTDIRNRLSELAMELKQLIQSPSGTKAVTTQAAAALSHAEDTVKLLDMLNSNNVLYYQIPIKYDDHRSTAELYVMKRHKNRKRIDPHNSVLFLSLDTKNMGRIETILDVKGSNVSIGLRTESQFVSDFARANIKSLYSALSECGYKLTDIKYSIIDTSATPAQQEKLLTDAVRLKHGKVDLRI